MIMPKFAMKGDYLKHQDLPDGDDTIVTIINFKEEEIGQTKDVKWVLYFKEFDQGLALNATNGQSICESLESDEMNDWKGRKIALYVKHDVEFQGKRVSAIRVRPEPLVKIHHYAKAAPPEEARSPLVKQIGQDLEKTKTQAEAKKVYMESAVIDGLTPDEISEIAAMYNVRWKELKEHP
jgi:hypothetical protein